MNRCLKCGVECEGNFCHNCGENVQASKECPNCGAELACSAKFCNKCGYALKGNGATAPHGRPINQATVNSLTPQLDFTTVVYAILRYLSSAAFLLFSALMFAFMGASVANIDLGEFGADSLGNAYKADDLAIAIDGISGTLSSLLVFAIIGMVYAIFAVSAHFIPALRYKRIKRVDLTFITDCGTAVFYITALIHVFVCMAQISSADEGMDALKSGAALILIIVFAVLFLLLAAASLVVQMVCAKYFVAPHNAFEAKRKNYLLAQSHKTSWIRSHKKSIIAIVATAAACTVVGVAITATAMYEANIFRISKVNQIQLGYSQEQVIAVLGEPFAPSKETSTWEWYGSDAEKIANKLIENEKQAEQAAEKGDFVTIGKLLDEEVELLAQLSKMTYQYIAVEFSTNSLRTEVVSVYFEPKMTVALELEPEQKEVEKVNILNTTLRTGAVVEEYTAVEYAVEYKGGAYYMARSAAEFELSKIKWRDHFASYEVYKNSGSAMATNG